MIEILREKLALVGSGRKFHIKGGGFYNFLPLTLCGYVWDNDNVEEGLLSITEKYTDLCKSCLKAYIGLEVK